MRCDSHHILAATTKIWCESHLFLRNTDLVISKERTPGTTAKHERLHERSFGLDGVVQIVSCPRLKHLCQGVCAQLRMLRGPSQVVIFHLLEQDKAFLTISCERSSKLLRSLRIRACVLLVWIESVQILSCQKSVEADRKVEAFRVQ